MQLTADDKQAIIQTYRNVLKRNTIYSARAVYWLNDYTQVTRFRILADIDDLTGNAVLDLGCGLGDFSRYLHQRFKAVDYTGIDIVPEMIQSARYKYPAEDFQLKELADLPTTQPYDYLFASGAFSRKVEKHHDKYFALIKEMYLRANKGIAFNMLDIHNHIDNDLFAAYNPKAVEAFCLTLSPQVVLVQGYLEDDFTIYIYKP